MIPKRELAPVEGGGEDAETNGEKKRTAGGEEKTTPKKRTRADGEGEEEKTVAPSSRGEKTKDVVRDDEEEKEEEEEEGDDDDDDDDEFCIRETPSRSNRPRNSAQKRKMETGDGVDVSMDDDDTEVPDDKEATMKDVRKAEAEGRTFSSGTFDRNDPIEQLAELERFITKSGGDTAECLEGWSIYMTFRKHGASKGQPDLKIYPKDGFVAKDNTKDRAFYRSRLEVCRALGCPV